MVEPKCTIIYKVFQSTIQVLPQTAKLLCWYFVDDVPINAPHYCYYTKACMSTLIHLPSLPTLDRESHTHSKWLGSWSLNADLEALSDENTTPRPKPGREAW